MEPLEGLSRWQWCVDTPECTPLQVTAVPKLSKVEEISATLMNVLRRSVIREDLAVASADVGFLEANTQVVRMLVAIMMVTWWW